MNIYVGLAPLVSLIAGILILIVPRLLNCLVAINPHRVARTVWRRKFSFAVIDRC
jgi:hypothetical protein